MESKPKQFLLKVLSGPHQGAEVVLTEGSTTIGSAEECEVVLADALIAPKHLEIRITQDKITLVPEKNCTVFINGKKIKEASQESLPFEYITLGTTHLVIGPEGETWPPLSVSDIPKIVEGEPESVGGKQEQPVPASQADKIQVASPLPQTNAEPQNNNAVNVSPLLKWLIPLGGLVALLILGVIAWVALNSTDVPVELPNYKSVIEKKINELNFQDNDTLSVEKLDDRYLVMGYVQDSAQQQHLQKAIRPVVPNRVSFKIWNQEKILGDCQDVFQMKGLRHVHVQVEPGKWGNLRVQGYVYNDDIYKRVKERLLQDVYGLKNIEEDIMTPVQVMEAVQKKLLKYNLSAYFNYRVGPNNVVIRGAIDQRLAPTWDSAKKEIKEAIEKWLPVDTQATIVAPEVAAKRSFFDGEVESVTIGETKGGNYITMKTGKRYSTGSVLPTGYRISDISPDGVILDKDNESVTIKIEDM